ncbi:hypothetical protein [Streptomyces sp. SYP-A7193]|uniref:hypothetical protein n=1 Tax=Streptomyces sp. SYP-A7193 TaxID=2662065 RepID=UPI0012913644|nr:hypothetical protein [Streptomyces sp. SYP-A7193]QFX80085.1 hypothetical protein GEV49_03475 [Streptomyces sp. SYP-A7193]
MRTGLVTDALAAAEWTRGGLSGAVLHTDHGAQGELNWSLQHQTSGSSGAVASPQGHVERVEDELGPLAGGGGSAHDRVGEDVHDDAT